HGTTFGGNPIACRMGNAVLDEIEQSSLLARINETGAWFAEELAKLKTRVPGGIVEIRGMGMMWGIELDRPAKEIASQLLAKGFVVGTALDNVLRLLPPYITPKRAFVEFVAALEKELSVVSGQLSTPARQPITDNRQLVSQGAIPQ
ncbi:MAG TPA: aminotransferase class III-fold pyridoxal phosphate-dependent enzyme, partial [Thermoanaerobaculia bacterium]